MSEGSVDWSAAAAAKRPVPVPMVDGEVGRCVWVSLLPAMKALTNFDEPRVRHGASGPKTSGLSEPCASTVWPKAWKAASVLPDLATSTCGQRSWNQAKPPVPATRCTERLVVEQ